MTHCLVYIMNSKIFILKLKLRKDVDDAGREKYFLKMCKIVSVSLVAIHTCIHNWPFQCVISEHSCIHS